MSFLQNLANKQAQQQVTAPQPVAVPITVGAEQESLAAAYREPYRVNGPISSNTTPAVRDRLQVLPDPLANYRR